MAIVQQRSPSQRSFSHLRSVAALQAVGSELSAPDSAKELLPLSAPGMKCELCDAFLLDVSNPIYDRSHVVTMRLMTNIASALKSEIARIARKEVRSKTQDVRKASAQYRTHIAALRRRIDELERELKRAKRTRGASAPSSHEKAQDDAVHRRFSASRLAATRKKLGLSAADFGALIGVTGQSIYKWEAGETRPRAQQLEAIATVRGIGKREAAQRLEHLHAAAS
jgi:DNA-binding transcriptional regulator YiaG